MKKSVLQLDSPASAQSLLYLGINEKSFDPRWIQKLLLLLCCFQAGVETCTEEDRFSVQDGTKRHEATRPEDGKKPIHCGVVGSRGEQELSRCSEQEWTCARSSFLSSGTTQRLRV